jgi:hypothetical protein
MLTSWRPGRYPRVRLKGERMEVPGRGSRWRYFLFGSTPDERHRLWVEADIESGRAARRQSFLTGIGLVVGGFIHLILSGTASVFIGMLIGAALFVPLGPLLFGRLWHRGWKRFHTRRWEARRSQGG